MRQYCRVRLKSGETASIVEILEDGKAYLADVDHKDGSIPTDFIAQDDIEAVL